MLQIIGIEVLNKIPWYVLSYVLCNLYIVGQKWKNSAIKKAKLHLFSNFSPLVTVGQKNFIVQAQKTRESNKPRKSREH